MIVTGWNNGSPNNRTGSGYGIKLKRLDRDAYFSKGWPSVTIELENRDLVYPRLSNSFWKTCTELRGKKIGKWMLDNELATWPKGNPPHFKLEHLGDRKFKLSRL